MQFLTLLLLLLHQQNIRLFLAVDVRIRSLRAALGEAGKQIKTVFKAGYRMEEG